MRSLEENTRSEAEMVTRASRSGVQRECDYSKKIAVQTRSVEIAAVQGASQREVRKKRRAEGPTTKRLGI